MPAPLPRIAAAWSVLLLLVCGGALADQLDPTSRADAEIVVLVAIADRLQADCVVSGDMDEATQTAYSGWVEANHVERVRAQMARFATDPAMRDAMDALNNQAGQAIDAAGGQSCAALRSLVAMPAASFAARTAQLPEVSPPVPAPAAPAASAVDMRGLAAQIEGFAFDSRTGVGWGGAVTLVIYPVVLFKNGEALTEVEGLGFADGIAAHRRANPDEWTQWRRAGGEIQTLKDGAWASLPFNAVYAKVPEGFALSGRYQRTGGTGNVALGGTHSVTTWETYDFWSGGQVVKGGGAGAYAEGGDWATTAQGVSADRRGSYGIDGLTLVMTFEDGSTENAILVTDPQDPKVIWLNGRDFSRQKTE